jgi:hypothetical protein
MPFKIDSKEAAPDMDVSFDTLTEHQRYKLMKVSRIHAGCSAISAPQVCMPQQYFDPIVCDRHGRNAERI